MFLPDVFSLVILQSIVKNTSFEKKEKCNCTPLQKCCKQFGCIWLFFSLRVDFSQTFWKYFSVFEVFVASGMSLELFELFGELKEFHSWDNHTSTITDHFGVVQV